MLPNTPLARARMGVFGYFTTSGFLMGVWAAGLPALDERLDLGPGRLGTTLLLISCGALVSMSFVGRACDRFTSRTVTRIAGPLAALALLGPALAPSFTVLTMVAFGYGLTVGVIEVSMNVNSVEVEARYGRPIVSAFHGFWSLGGAAGGALVSVGLHLAADAQAMLVAAIAVSLLVFLLSGRVLLAPPEASETADGQSARRGGLKWIVVFMLGVAAFAGHISEGAAIDWAAIHAHRILEVDLASAPIAYTVFGIAMTTVRLAGDPIRARLGSSLTLAIAGVLATVGYALALASPLAGGAAFPVACVGWALTGMGLATVVPVIFSAVGAAGGSVGKELSMVTMFGSAGLLTGPAVIGHLAEATSLPLALTIPAALSLVVLIAGPPAVRALGRGADIGRVPAETTAARS